MGILLEPRARLQHRCDVRGILPEGEGDSLPEQIAAAPITYGNQRVELGELFQLTSHAADGLVWEGDLRLVDFLGYGLASGRVEVRGDCGLYAAAKMTGGTITIRGSVSHAAGQGASGGLLQVSGDVGNECGGHAPGEKHGLRGASIVVGGNAGDYLGMRMRRGKIMVGGNAGLFAGFHMLAGTLAIAGCCQRGIGLNMVRGTIIVLGHAAQTLRPLLDEPAASRSVDARRTITDSPIFRMLARELSRSSAGLSRQPNPDSVSPPNWKQLEQPLEVLDIRRGEILCPTASS